MAENTRMDLPGRHFEAESASVSFAGGGCRVLSLLFLLSLLLLLLLPSSMLKRCRGGQCCWVWIPGLTNSNGGSTTLTHSIPVCSLLLWLLLFCRSELHRNALE